MVKFSAGHILIINNNININMKVSLYELIDKLNERRSNIINYDTNRLSNDLIIKDINNNNILSNGLSIVKSLLIDYLNENINDNNNININIRIEELNDDNKLNDIIKLYLTENIEPKGLLIGKLIEDINNDNNNISIATNHSLSKVVFNYVNIYVSFVSDVIAHIYYYIQILVIKKYLMLY
eukprot:511362_1